MNAVDVLRAGFGQAHRMMEGAVGDCDEATLQYTGAAAVIGNIGAIYFHAVCDEDLMVHGMLQGKPTLHQSGGWETKLGLAMPGPMQTLEWAKGLKLPNLAAVREYASAVYAATDGYLAGLSADDLDQEVEVFGQKQRRGHVLTGVLLWHAISHQGEISALKGVQGKKGLPF